MPVRSWPMRVAAMVLVLTSSWGCATAPSSAPPEPQVLVSTDALTRPFMARQRVVASHAGRQTAFEAVLQFDGSELLLLALTPLGTKAFVLRQRGVEVEFEAFVDDPLPFDPRYILEDVHRTYFVGLPGAPLGDGWHEARRGEEILRERWAARRLHERRFEPCRGSEPPIVVIYEGGLDPAAGLPSVRLQHGRHGYVLDIETLDYRALSAGVSGVTRLGRH